MPCYTLITVTVAFKATVKDRLIEAITNAGYIPVDIGNAVGIKHSRGEFWVDLENQSVNASRVDLEAYKDVLNSVKREYSRLTIQNAVKRKKWALRADKNNVNKLQARRY